MHNLLSKTQAAMEEIPIKVAVRIRPLLCKEVLHNHQVCVRDIPNTQQIIIGRDRVFTFDFVYLNTVYLLVGLAKGLSILIIFSKNQLLLSLILCIVLFISD